MITIASCRGPKCRGGNTAIDSQVIEECLDLSIPQRVGMPFVVKVDELSNPGSVAVFCVETEVTAAANDRKLIHKTGWGGLTP